jgi:predicted lipoprotein with Yx(FWY)xxD motif
MMRISRLGLLLVVAAVSVVGCGSRTPSSSSSSKVPSLAVASNPKLGRYLVADGHTLYMYPPDKQRAVTCTKAEDCTTAWPPLFVPAGKKAAAGTGVSAGLIGSMPGDGGRVVTYDKWPLYFYIGDSQAGGVHGQDQGFDWFVISPSGRPVKTGPVGGD